MEEIVTYYVDVVLPLHLPQYYTYRVPLEYNADITVGQRVVVQFGGNKVYSAVVRKVHQQAPNYANVKYIMAILDPQPVVTELQLEFWEWMAQYYMCCVGDVMAVALPSAYRLQSESFIQIHPDFSGEIDNLSQNEIKVLDVLATNTTVKVSDVAKIVNFRKIMPLLKTLIEKKIIIMDEELKQRYTPKTETYLKLNPEYLDDEKGRQLFESLEKKTSTHKQLEVLMKFFQQTDFGKQPIRKNIFTADKELSVSSLKTLVKNGILQSFDQQESRLEDVEKTQSVATIKLSDQQQQAFDKIDVLNPDALQVTLVHGVTSSGKTELYIKLINEVVKQGKQVLYLLPEIALTAQIINRLRKYFGKKVGIYHSKFSPNERAEVWTKALNPKHNGYQVIIGARSAMFLPFQNLGLVIVDEEHDPSFKQYDPAPRYNARDAAIYLAHRCGAKVVLGTATPSVETYFNATSGKYALVQMDKRYGDVQMPEICIADMRRASGQDRVRSNYSKMLTDAISEALQNNEQVIIFQNRRGFSLRLECPTCGWIPTCTHCDVSLVYHKQTNSLRCHYCGYSIPVPSECPQCHSTFLKMRGFGTEKIEDELSIIFPQARIERMDLDSVSSGKSRYADIINRFEDRNIDILVGTQMITKGLDFENVSVVGIISADNMISFPDFRAFERSFQQMTQVSGRAGRHGKRGKVIIQTYNPAHQVIDYVLRNDYKAMYRSQINERRVFGYPPFVKLIYLTLKHVDSQVLDKAAAELTAALRQILGNRVVGPEYPMVSRVRNMYLKNIMIRLERTYPLGDAKRAIEQQAAQLLGCKEYSRLRIIPDVDPQ
ncbi:MAG: primosomal protein N' [Bacteroidales bacterium]|nr:primosomal protein N' [Bacteroidales bacterium]